AKCSTGLSGKNSRNSLQSCAARVLLWAITSVGLCIRSMAPAIVNVLPVPVAPSSVWKGSFASSPSTSPSIAFGWSAVGLYAGLSLNAGISMSLAGAAPGTAVRGTARPGIRAAMGGLILGPMLRYVSQTEATVWVETDEPCEVEVFGGSDQTSCIA